MADKVPIAPPGQEGCDIKKKRDGVVAQHRCVALRQPRNQICNYWTTTPSAPSNDAARHFHGVASTPPGQEGQSAFCQPGMLLPL